MSQPTALALEAPAKLNLDLRVVGRREDGLHLLESTLVLLELADRLLLMAGCSGLRVEGAPGAAVEGIPLDERNLAWRGLVAGLAGPPDLACLALEKRIPAAAGLGGGSSDAAAAWRLGRAWRGAPEPAAAAEIAELAEIGADVPFFAAAVPAARVGGIGEIVTPVAPTARALEVVLVHPGFALETERVFAALRPEEWGRGGNDLLSAATRLRPEIADLFALVVAAGGEPRLSGSGPTVFTLIDDAERARGLAQRLRRAGLAVGLTRTRGEAASIERGMEEEH